MIEPLTDVDRYEAALLVGADLIKENLELKRQVRQLTREREEWRRKAERDDEKG